MEGPSISNRAALLAVVVAFATGMFSSLAIRPVHQSAESSNFLSSERVAGTGRIRWRMPTTFQTSTPVIGENPIYVSEAIRKASGGEVQIDVFEPDEIVPTFAITDAVRDGKVDVGYTWLGYDQGKIPASPLVSAVPFGMEPWEYTAWWYEAGGRELTEELYEPNTVYPILCGITGPETAGWFRRKLESLEELKGLKIRFAGLGGRVIERLGASVTMLPGGEIFQALEKGVIDATEFSLPIVDQALGFNRVAKFNYYPGWHQPFTAFHMIVNLDVWRGLSHMDKALLDTGCTAGVTRNLAAAEAHQGTVLEDFAEIGVSAETFSPQLLFELRKVSNEVLNDEAERDSNFAEILKSQRDFRRTYAQWKSRAYLPRAF